jgi:hypothetical protein
MDLFLRQPDNERVAIIVNLDSPNRHEELFRFEPAAGIHDEVVGATGFGINDEPIDVSEFLVGTVAHKHVVDVQGLIVNLVCFDVSQPRLWMIHGFSPICAMREECPSKSRASLASSSYIVTSSLPFEILHSTFVLFCSRSRLESPQVPSPTGSWIDSA